jgi:hypothetical protein
MWFAPRSTSASAVALLICVCLIPPPSRSEDCESSKQAVQLCALIANAAQYNGKSTLIRGLYHMAFHGSVLSSSDCPKVDVNLRRAQSWRGDKHARATMKSILKKDQFRFVDIVIRGKFRVAQQGQCFGQDCLQYEIEESELLCAAPANPN